jgi:hypothetical protein
VTNDIQRARDVLAKWRDGDLDPWHIDESGYIDDIDNHPVTGGATEGDARLIVGTAGNPDLWDAWDGMLAQVDLIRETCPAVLIAFANRIATAIIAADERMSA